MRELVYFIPLIVPLTVIPFIYLTFGAMASIMFSMSFCWYLIAFKK